MPEAYGPDVIHQAKSVIAPLLQYVGKPTNLVQVLHAQWLLGTLTMVYTGHFTAKP